MELAMRRALGEMHGEQVVQQGVAVKARSAKRGDLGDVFSRMLREYRENREEDAN
jgi:hypothetical protein